MRGHGWALVLTAVVALGLWAWPVAGQSKRPMPRPVEPGPLEGLWRGKVVQGDGGRDVPVELTVRGNKVTGKAKGEPQGGGVFTMTGDAKGSMDLVGTEGTQRGQKYAGIYELDGENLKWCLSTNVRRRPKEFATKNGNYLLVLKRQGGAARTTQTTP